MIAFHCFAELPQLDPKSGNGWTNRAHYETDAVLPWRCAESSPSTATAAMC